MAVSGEKARCDRHGTSLSLLKRGVVGAGCRVPASIPGIPLGMRRWQRHLRHLPMPGGLRLRPWGTEPTKTTGVTVKRTIQFWAMVVVPERMGERGAIRLRGRLFSAALLTL